MELHSLEIKNFRPRDNVVEAGTLLTQEILAEIPIDGKAKVVISDQGDSFFFSVVAKSSSRLFSSEGRWKKRETHGWPRDWQITALLQVLRDLARRITGIVKPEENLNLENKNDP
jgi:hypothetical protein